MAIGVFGLNRIYKKQNDNIKERNLSQWPESGLHGYAGLGNEGGGAISSILRIEFSSETMSNPGKSLGHTAQDSASISSSLYGYFAGGVIYNNPNPNGARYCNVSRLDFSNETVSQPGKNLPFIYTYFSGFSGPTYGYFAGGSTDTFAVYNPWGPFSYWAVNYTCTINRLDFFNESVSSIPNTLPGRIIHLGSTSNNSYGYFAGGNFISVGYVTSVGRLDFSTDIVNYPGKNLLTGRDLVSGTKSSAYGYFIGGSSSTAVDRLDFSTENISNPGQNLPQGISASTSTQNSSYSYLMGGYTSAYINTVHRLDFSTETINAPGKNLPTTRGSHCSVTGGASILKPNRSSGYFAGGYSTGYVSSIVKLSFSNDTVSVSGTSLSQSVEALSTVSSNQYGYFAGGLTANSPAPVRSSSLDRIDYLNDTRITSTVPQLQRNNAGATSSSSYGYFGGGGANPEPTILSNFVRLDFSSGTVSNPSKNLSSTFSSADAISNNNFGYYAGGGISTINRLDFSNETVSQPGKNLPSARALIAATSNNFYGYFGGGVVSPSTLINTITRLDFSTETVSDPGNNLPGSRSTFAATSSSLYGYFGGGNVGPAFISNISRLDLSTEGLANTTNLPSNINGLCATKNSN